MRFVNSLKGETTIAAHSLGNLVVSSAQTDAGMSVANFYMTNAAQSLEQYEVNASPSTNLQHWEWKNYQARTWASEWHSLFDSSDQRSKLTWRGRVTVHSGKRFNFYSDVSGGLGDHVMRTPSIQTDEDWVIQFNAGIGAFIGGAEDGREAFCLQERLKGHFFLSSMGSSYGGWRLTENHNIPPSPSYETPTTAEAQAFTDVQLQTKPVFDPGFYIKISPPSSDGETRFIRDGAPSWIKDLTDAAKGSAVAGQNESRLLSEMIPGLTLAVGGNPLPNFGDDNINMQSSMHLGWPAGRTADDEPVAWWHGDLKDVSYTYVFLLFDKWVELGALK